LTRSSLVTRIVAAATVIALAVGALFLVFVLSLSTLRRATSRESRSKDVTVATVQLDTLTADLDNGVRLYVADRKPRFLVPYNEASAQWPAAAARLRTLVRGDAVQEQRAQEVTRQIRDYLQDYADPIIAIANVAPEVARSQESTDEGRKRIDGIRRGLLQILSTENARSRQRIADANGVARRAEIAGIAGLAASIVLVLLFGAWVARAVARPVRQAADAATDVAAGEFEVRLPERGVGEIAALGVAFNSMTRSLAESRKAVLEQNEQLQASERHKSDLISMVSHELRTPLSSVLGFTRLLLDRDFGEEERRRYLQIVDTEARRLASLAEDFLDVRLLEEGRFDLDVEPLDLVTLVREQVLLFFGTTREHELELDLPLASVVVDADRDRLAQVIGNLFSNAIKYSPEGGSIEVRLRIERTTARLSVTDEGVGIPREHQARIFEKFFRGGAVAAGIGGTGLGLAVAREIVEAHGGEIGFRSTEGIGSTFWMRLPLSGSEPLRDLEPEEPEARPVHAQQQTRR
jgi:signal transduction histidine kinase